MAGNTCLHLEEVSMNERLPSSKKRKGAISWQELQKVTHPALAAAPQLDWSRIDRRALGYLLGTVSDTLWFNQLAVSMPVGMFSSRATKSNPSTHGDRENILLAT
jgi:hypothetical protein